MNADITDEQIKRMAEIILSDEYSKKKLRTLIDAMIDFSVEVRSAYRQVIGEEREILYEEIKKRREQN